MEADFWHERWRGNRIGFHQRDTNPHLRVFWRRMPVRPGDPVFVPLCGKSLDMLWLREQQHPVIGVEISPIAVQAFFEENNLNLRRSQQGPFSLCETTDIRILCGDFFALEADMLEGVTAVYDRASLTALPPGMRAGFAAKLTELLPVGTPMLLVTMEYPQDEMNGPPFAVEETELRDLFSHDWSIQVLDQADILAGEPKFRERGLSGLTEKIYLLSRQQAGQVS